MRTAPIAKTAVMTIAAAATNAKRHVSTVAATPPSSSGTTVPPRLTVTSPSVIATVRRGPCASASAAHILTSAEVPNRLMKNAPGTVIVIASP